MLALPSTHEIAVNHRYRSIRNRQPIRRVEADSVRAVCPFGADRARSRVSRECRRLVSRVASCLSSSSELSLSRCLFRLCRDRARSRFFSLLLARSPSRSIASSLARSFSGRPVVGQRNNSVNNHEYTDGNENSSSFVKFRRVSSTRDVSCPRRVPEFRACSRFTRESPRTFTSFVAVWLRDRRAKRERERATGYRQRRDERQRPSQRREPRTEWPRACMGAIRPGGRGQRAEETKYVSRYQPILRTLSRCTVKSVFLD